VGRVVEPREQRTVRRGEDLILADAGWLDTKASVASTADSSADALATPYGPFRADWSTG